MCPKHAWWYDVNDAGGAAQTKEMVLHKIEILLNAIQTQYKNFQKKALSCWKIVQNVYWNYIDKWLKMLSCNIKIKWAG